MNSFILLFYENNKIKSAGSGGGGGRGVGLSCQATSLILGVTSSDPARIRTLPKWAKLCWH